MILDHPIVKEIFDYMEMGTANLSARIASPLPIS